MTLRSATLVKQVLVSGAVVDSLTGDAPLGVLNLDLIDQITGKSFPLIKNTRKDGSFGFVGAPGIAFPLFATQEYRLRLVASAANYEESTFDFVVGPAEGQPESVEVTMSADGIDDTTISLFNGGGLPRSKIEMVLVRNQVVLTGKVHGSDDPSDGIDAASVKVLTSSEAVTGADGKFRMPEPLPMALSVEISTEAPGFELSRITYEPDYSKPVNYVSIPLRRTT